MTKHLKTTNVLFTLFTVILIAGLSLQTVFAATPVLNLPTNPVNVTYSNWLAGTNSTMDLTISNVGSGFDVSDGVFPGWANPQ